MVEPAPLVSHVGQKDSAREQKMKRTAESTALATGLHKSRIVAPVR